jgi:hypothetical protein
LYWSSGGCNPDFYKSKIFIHKVYIIDNHNSLIEKLWFIYSDYQIRIMNAEIIKPYSFHFIYGFLLLFKSNHSLIDEIWKQTKIVKRWKVKQFHRSLWNENVILFDMKSKRLEENWLLIKGIKMKNGNEL